MTNLVQCSQCGSVLIAESFKFHECAIPLKKIKHISAQSILDLTTDKTQTFLISGVDGTDYFFEIREKEALPWPPDDNLHKKNPTGSLQNQKRKRLFCCQDYYTERNRRKNSC